MVSAGALIWISAKPILKMAFSTAFGFMLTRCDLFGSVAAKGAGQVVLNIFIPALLFSKIVSAIDIHRTAAIGPSILIGVLYEVIGLLLAFIVRQFFWVPHRFRYGILVAGCWGNWGAMPIAAIMSITAASPFNGSSDVDVAVAYVAIFMFIFFFSLFPMGGHLLVAKDFKGPDLSDDEVRESFAVKAKKTARSVSNLLRWRRNPRPQPDDTERAGAQWSVAPEKKPEAGLSWNNNGGTTGEPVTTMEAEYDIRQRSDGTKRVGFHFDDEKSKQIKANAPTSYAGTTVAATTAENDDAGTAPLARETLEGLELGSGRNRTAFQRILGWLRTLYSPPTIAIIVSFPVALIPRLKGLFITLPTSPHGPDGQAPLSLVMDTAVFLGDASIPLGLVCLGSALANLNIPRPFTRLPLGAITAFTLAKMVIMPILGVLITQLFTNGIPIIDPNDKVLRFVCIFFSAVPTATTQVYLTQIASPDGSAEHLGAFLVPQYVLMFLTMATLNTYSLHLLF